MERTSICGVMAIVADFFVFSWVLFTTMELSLGYVQEGSNWGGKGEYIAQRQNCTTCRSKGVQIGSPRSGSQVSQVRGILAGGLARLGGLWDRPDTQNIYLRKVNLRNTIKPLKYSQI